MGLRTLPARVYHLAEAANWPSIRRSGLLSTTALLDQAGVQGNKRERIERSQRLQHLVLPNGVQVRDQKPLPARVGRLPCRHAAVGMVWADQFSGIFLVGHGSIESAAARLRIQASGRAGHRCRTTRGAVRRANGPVADQFGECAPSAGKARTMHLRAIS